MAESNKPIIQQWINAKFEGRIVASLVQRGQYFNPQISIIKGKEYETKLGKATQVQLGLNDVKDLVKTLTEIIVKMEELMPKKEAKDESTEAND